MTHIAVYYKRLITCAATDDDDDDDDNNDGDDGCKRFRLMHGLVKSLLVPD